MSSGTKFRRAVGSVLRVKTSKGYRYLQFVGPDPKGADIFRVTNLVTNEETATADDAGKAHTLYWIQGIGRILLEDNRYAYIGVGPVAGPAPRFRRRFFGGWITMDGAEHFVKNPISLEVAKMSLDEMLPADIIVERLDAGWLPEHDRDDVIGDIRRAATGADKAARGDTDVSFFIEFGDPLTATKALTALKERGYRAELEHDTRAIAVTKTFKKGDVAQSLSSVRDDIVSIAHKFGGSLSGTEASTNIQ